jgi:hypothetical protein
MLKFVVRESNGVIASNFLENDGGDAVESSMNQTQHNH